MSTLERSVQLMGQYNPLLWAPPWLRLWLAALLVIGLVFKEFWRRRNASTRGRRAQVRPRSHWLITILIGHCVYFIGAGALQLYWKDELERTTFATVVAAAHIAFGLANIIWGLGVARELSMRASMIVMYWAALICAVIACMALFYLVVDRTGSERLIVLVEHVAWTLCLVFLIGALMSLVKDRLLRQRR